MVGMKRLFYGVALVHGLIAQIIVKLILTELTPAVKAYDRKNYCTRQDVYKRQILN